MAIDSPKLLSDAIKHHLRGMGFRKWSGWYLGTVSYMNRAENIRLDFTTNIYSMGNMTSHVVASTPSGSIASAKSEAWGYDELILKIRDKLMKAGGLGDYDEEEDDEEEFRPDEEDIYIRDRGVFQDGKLISRAIEWDDIARDIRNWMEKHQFWPNVWQVSDHGNMELVTDL